MFSYKYHEKGMKLAGLYSYDFGSKKIAQEK